MNRVLLVAVGILSVDLFGCSRSTMPPAPEHAKPENIASTAPAAAPASLAPSVTPDQKPTSSVPPSGNSRLRELAARLLESDGQGGWRKNEKAATELEKLNAEEVAQLWPLLKDPQAEVRRGTAVFLLGLFDPNDSNQVSAFVSLLDDSDRMVRARALDAVRQYSHADQLAVLTRLSALLDVQREDRPENRIAIARLCGSLKQEASDSLPALQAAAAGDPDAKVRSAALVAIGQIAEPQAVVPPLTKGLADKDAAVRLVAAARLRQLGSTAASSAKELASTLADPNNDVAEAAAEALIRIGSAAVEPVVGQLSSKNASARKLALICLARIGPAAKSAVPQIEKLKQDPDSQVRQLANAALKQLGVQ
jgi:HEAT repeat protein